MTQEKIILNYLRELGDWKLEYEIRGINTRFGWIGASGDRSVRRLIKKGLLHKDKKGIYRTVKYKEAKPLTQEEQEKESDDLLHAAML